MNFNEYQEFAKTTAVYPNAGENIIYPTLGLAGEAGEVANKVGKIVRDKNSVPTEEDKKELVKELGDVLWFMSALANELGVALEDVAKINIEKLKSRMERGVLGGSGDNR